MTKKVSKDRLLRAWQQEFPALSRIKGKLVRRVGPLIQGVTLQIGSDAGHYTPVAFLHSLLREGPTIRLSVPLTIENEYFTDVSEVHVAARRLRELSSLPYSGDLNVSNVLDFYRTYFSSHPHYYVLEDLQDGALLAGYCGRSELLVNWLHYCKMVFEGWPNRVKNDCPAFSHWSETTSTQASDRHALAGTVTRQIHQHQLNDLVSANLVCEK